MIARRLALTILTALCALVCAFVAGASVAVAATQFGSYGEEAEQFNGPTGVAVDAAGDVYVGDQGNNRVDKFDGSGSFLLAWGSGVANGAGEMQTCMTECRDGSQVSSQEAMELPSGVAVDDELSSLSYGDVYVVDNGHKNIEKFDPSGKFILMFGGNVNETTGEDVCRAGEKCKLYATTGTADGEFEGWPSFSSSFIAVGPGGAVYVGDKARVEVFEPSGAWKENISLSGLSSEGRPTALAVDSAGNVFLKDEGMAGVREFEPNGTEKSTKFDSTSTSVTALALDSTGDVYVGDSSGGFRVLKYDSAGKELADFASKTVANINGGLAFSSATGHLYASDADAVQGFGSGHAASMWILTPPPPGPLIDGESATPEPRGAATLGAQLDPEGNETTYHFEYVDNAHFKASGYASATSTTPVSIGSTPTFDDQSVSVSLPKGTLVPGVTYHYRLVAHDSLAHTSTGVDQSFQETPPALIVGPWTADVSGTSVTFGAKIDPLGANTSYRLEYGPSSSYGHTVLGNVGEGMSYIPISRHVQELEPVTTYHYRVVTSNEVGTWESADQTFTTQSAGGELVLPDGRAWELVSPANKRGALIEPELDAQYGDVQAASDGSGITYLASLPVTERAPSSSLGNQVLSRRRPSGWSSQEIGVTEKLPEIQNPAASLARAPAAMLFSADLSRAVIEPGKEDLQSLSADATERTLYLYDSAANAILPLVTSANVPTGTKFGGEPATNGKGTFSEMAFLAATPDLSHVVFESPLSLTPEAVEGPGKCLSSGEFNCPENLYEWSAGRLALVDILPNGEPLHGAELDGAYLGRTSEDVIHAVSTDGRRIVWAHGGLWGNTSTNTLYVRDMAEARTLQFGGPKARFETMSGDGSRVFFWEGSELYAFDIATDTTTDVTAGHGPGEHSAGVKDGFIMAASEDGAYVYYVATGVLAPGATGGEDNLYVSHDDDAGWTTTLIATLSKADEFAKEGGILSPRLKWADMAARVSPNGRYLAFMSNRSLTGYDNLDAVSEQPDEEVYLYDAVSGRLACASCNPTGARPSGQFFSSNSRPLVDRRGLWDEHWVAANIPGWRESNGSAILFSTPVYQPRYLSDSGRLFFNSSDALVAQDTNGLEDVYEYEPAGVGDCTNASVAFSERSGGCVKLITSGTSSGESAFMDASENGDDVFFATGSKLTAEDFDTTSDVYDAHVCTASSPCAVAPVSPPPCTSGDSCKAAPSPQPEIFGPTPSATFSGVGNVVVSSSKPVVSGRSLTQAQKLRRALRTCSKKDKHRRAACERQARRRYRATQSRKTKATRKGGR